MRGARKGWLLVGAILLTLIALALPIVLKGLAQRRIASALQVVGSMAYDNPGGIRKWLGGALGPERFCDIRAVHISAIVPLGGPLPEEMETPKLLRSLRQLGSLKELIVDDVDAQGFHEIRQMRSLTTLGLATSTVDEDDVITADEFAGLADLESLEDLRLESWQVTPEMLDVLSRFPALKTLDLRDSYIDGSSLAKFRDFPHLTWLNLRGVSFSVEEGEVPLSVDDLLLLADAPKLKDVLLSPNVDSAAENLDRARRLMPGITIHDEVFSK